MNPAKVIITSGSGSQVIQIPVASANRQSTGQSRLSEESVLPSQNIINVGGAFEQTVQNIISKSIINADSSPKNLLEVYADQRHASRTIINSSSSGGGFVTVVPKSTESALKETNKHNEVSVSKSPTSNSDGKYQNNYFFNKIICTF